MLLAALCMVTLFQSRKHGSSFDFRKFAEPVTIFASVADWPSTGMFSTRFPARNVLVASPTDTVVAAGALVTTDLDASAIVPGAFFSCRATLTFPRGIRNPGGFDDIAYLRRENSAFTARCIDNSSRTSSTRHTISSVFTSPLRREVRRRLVVSIRDSAHLPLFNALILGDRSGLSHETKRDFRVTGLMHVLAVSGLHVMLVVMIAFSSMRPLLLRLRATWLQTEWIRLAGGVGLLLTYCLLSGGSPSILRASIMTLLLMASHVASRQPNSINSLCIAALIILLAAPHQLFDPGFQLSFSAVTSIVLIVPSFTLQHPRLKRLIAPLIVTLAATLGTAPVLLKHFGSFSLSGFLLNPIAIPLTALTLLGGLQAALLATTPLGSVAGNSASFFADLLIGVTDWGSKNIPAEILADHFFDLTWITMGVVAIGVSCWNVARYRGKMVIMWVLIHVLFLGIRIFSDTMGPGMDVVFVDVGQGDAAVIRGPCGTTFLVDTGPGNINYSSGAVDVNNVARSLGVRKFDYVIISHPHSDHLGGLPGILNMIKIGTVVTNGQTYDSDLYRLSVRTIKSAGVNLLEVGDSVKLPTRRDCIRAYILGSNLSDSGANDASIILKLEYGNVSFLFTGDVEKNSEMFLARKYNSLLSSDVVKVPHHGSKTSSSRTFVQHIQEVGSSPFAVISSGANNRFGHPDPEVVIRWKEYGFTVKQTADSGAVWMRTEGRIVFEREWKKRN